MLYLLLAYFFGAIWTAWEFLKVYTTYPDMWQQALNDWEARHQRSANFTRRLGDKVVLLLALCWPILLWPLLRYKAVQGERKR